MVRVYIDHEDVIYRVHDAVYGVPPASPFKRVVVKDQSMHAPADKVPGGKEHGFKQFCADVLRSWQKTLAQVSSAAMTCVMSSSLARPLLSRFAARCTDRDGRP